MKDLVCKRNSGIVFFFTSMVMIIFIYKIFGAIGDKNLKKKCYNYVEIAHTSRISILNTGVPASRHNASGLRGTMLHP